MPLSLGERVGRSFPVLEAVWSSLGRDGSFRRWLLIVLLASALVRSAVAIAFWDSWIWQTGRLHDGWHFIGITLAEHGTYGFEAGEPTLLRTPVFPTVEALLYVLAGTRYAVWSVAFLLLDVLTTALLATMVRTTFGNRPALIAGCFHALHVPTAYYVAQIEQFSAVLPVMCIWIVVATRWLSTDALQVRRTIGLGLTTGLLVLNKSVYSTFPFALVAANLWSSRPLSTTIRRCSLLVSVVGIATAPWIIRNYHVSNGQMVQVQLLTWYNFMADVHWDELDSLQGTERADGALADHVELRQREIIEQCDLRPPPGASRATVEVLEERCYRSAAGRWMSENPGRIVAKAIKNLWQFWFGAENRHKTRLFVLMQVPYMSIAILSVLLLARAGRLREAGVSFGVIFLLWAPYTLVYAMGRFSLDLVPALALITGLGLGAGARRGVGCSRS